MHHLLQLGELESWPSLSPASALRRGELHLTWATERSWYEWGWARGHGRPVLSRQGSGPGEGQGLVYIFNLLSDTHNIFSFVPTTCNTVRRCLVYRKGGFRDDVKSRSWWETRVWAQGCLWATACLHLVVYVTVLRDTCRENTCCVYSVACKANLLCEVMNTSMSSFVVGVTG